MEKEGRTSKTGCGRDKEIEEAERLIQNERGTGRQKNGMALVKWGRFYPGLLKGFCVSMWPIFCLVYSYMIWIISWIYILAENFSCQVVLKSVIWLPVELVKQMKCTKSLE